jgi:hypothetical protein
MEYNLESDKETNVQLSKQKAFAPLKWLQGEQDCMCSVENMRTTGV